MADETTFADVYGCVAPDHPIFGRCQECGDYTHEGIDVLAAASQVGEGVARTLAMVGTPPEIVDFVLSVVVGRAAVSLVSMKRENEGTTTVLEVMPQIEEIINGLAARLPAELERIRKAAVTMAREQVQGSC